MVAKEYCCYTRPYSSIEGFQIAHTLYYSAKRRRKRELYWQCGGSREKSVSRSRSSARWATSGG